MEKHSGSHKLQTAPSGAPGSGTCCEHRAGELQQGAIFVNVNEFYIYSYGTIVKEDPRWNLNAVYSPLSINPLPKTIFKIRFLHLKEKKKNPYQ